MPIQRLIVPVVLALACSLAAPLYAAVTPVAGASFTTIAPVGSQSTGHAASLQTPGWPMQAGTVASPLLALRAAANMPAASAVDGQPAATQVDTKVADLRSALIALAMDLRNTRYVRGGRDPSTGFDCSGFVRYVFAHAIGMKLPTSSASQFLAGLKISREDMKPGDLVFFKTGRKRHISHVGIYISDGRFIHSPATGKTVQISNLSESYWAKRFAGAKRPPAIVTAARNG